MKEFYLFHPDIQHFLNEKSQTIQEKLHRIKITTLIDRGVEPILEELFDGIWVDAPNIDFEKIKHEAYTKPPVHFVEYFMPFTGDDDLLRFQYYSGDSLVSGFITQATDSNQKYLHFRFRDENWARMFGEDGEMRPESKREILRQRNNAIEMLKKHIPLNNQRFKEWYMEKRTELRTYLEAQYKNGGGGITPNTEGL